MKKIIVVLITLAMILVMISCGNSEGGSAGYDEGAKIIASGDWGYEGNILKWELNEKSELVISGNGKMLDASFYHPALWDSQKGKIKEVVIKEGITNIGNAAFYGASGLTEISIPNSVTSIGEYAFWCCRLTSITIPSSVTSIGEFAFANCVRLTSITIPSSITKIGYATFFNCNNLTSITIPSSVTSIDNSAFNFCDSLENITVDEKNNKYSSVNGVLFNKDRTELLCYPVGKADKLYSIPSSVKSIGNKAFYECTSITSITIPPNVTSIGENAFYNCSSLTSITIPPNVTKIGDYAFRGCNADLVIICQAGSYAEEYAIINLYDRKMTNLLPKLR